MHRHRNWTRRTRRRCGVSKALFCMGRRRVVGCDEWFVNYFRPRWHPATHRRPGVGEKKSRRHPTHPTTRRPPMRFNGLLAVGRRQVRQVGPHGPLTRSLPMRFYLCERAVREAFGMLARDDCFGANFGRRQAARLCIRGCFCMPENGQKKTFPDDWRRAGMPQLRTKGTRKKAARRPLRIG